MVKKKVICKVEDIFFGKGGGGGVGGGQLNA